MNSIRSFRVIEKKDIARTEIWELPELLLYLTTSLYDFKS